MLCIDKCRRTACLLRLCNCMQGQRGLTRAFWSINFNDPPLRQTANAERNIQTKRACGHCINSNSLTATQLHRRAFTKSAINLRERRF